MGYRSDVRIIMKTQDYENILSRAKEENEAVYSFMKEDSESLEKFEYRQNKEYVYLGWNCVKWYFEDGYESKYIEEKMKELDEYWFVRIGEDMTDIEEYYNMSLDYHDDGIYICRCFED